MGDKHVHTFGYLLSYTSIQTAVFLIAISAEAFDPHGRLDKHRGDPLLTEAFALAEAYVESFLKKSMAYSKPLPSGVYLAILIVSPTLREWHFSLQDARYKFKRR